MNQLVRPMFPSFVDSSMLSTFRSCPQKFFRTYMQHWKPKAESVHLVAGKAFAKGVEVARRAFFEHSAPIPESQALGLGALIKEYGDFECPSDSAKSLERMCGALEYYFEQYPLDSGLIPVKFASGRYGIEFKFAEPLDIDNPETGEPMIYTGTADAIANFAGGVYICDEKTTSQLGASWPRQWELRSQFTGYAWAARKAGIKVDGAIVRGVSILKTKYDTLQTVTDRPAWEVDRWVDQVHRDVGRMIQCWKDDHWDYNLDHACAEYGGCSLQRICKSQDPDTWLPMQFDKRVWDPVVREETDVESWEAKCRAERATS